MLTTSGLLGRKTDNHVVLRIFRVDQLEHLGNLLDGANCGVTPSHRTSEWGMADFADN